MLGFSAHCIIVPGNSLAVTTYQATQTTIFMTGAGEVCHTYRDSFILQASAKMLEQDPFASSLT